MKDTDHSFLFNLKYTLQKCNRLYYKFKR